MLVLLFLAPVAGPPSPVSVLSPLLERAGSYVVAYEESFRNVIAQEVYRQTLTMRRFALSEAGADLRQSSTVSRQRRTLRSDIVYVTLPGTIPWGSFRDTYEVDGKAVRDREDRLVRLLSGGRPPDLKQAEAILAESARHNLGAAPRNYNLPLFALLFLLPQNQQRFKFQLHGESRVRQARVVEVDFEELTRPTIIHELSAGDDVQTHGRFWIEPASGRVLRTEMRVSPPGTEGRLRVEFGLVEKLGLLAPTEMQDVFGNDAMLFEGTAQYRNYRRFETSVGPITFER